MVGNSNWRESRIDTLWDKTYIVFVLFYLVKGYLRKTINKFQFTVNDLEVFLYFYENKKYFVTLWRSLTKIRNN